MASVQEAMPFDDAVESPGLDELLAAAETGPRAWRAGLREHLAAYPGERHGRPCFHCHAVAIGYGLGWAYDHGRSGASR